MAASSSWTSSCRWAQIILCDPHCAVVVGPSFYQWAARHQPRHPFKMALVLAAYADGVTRIGNIQIDRGYQQIDEKLRSLGARIERAEE
ncbi:MAG: hypothetical protein R2856_12745 [Caldilineaceae bacterium]